ncbi:MAG: aminotransferase class I/II-fold pyridoxal phosphate-dependent enzyme [Bacteroidota bacterium]
MKINAFKLERYFAQHEFTAKYLLSSSDCDGLSLRQVLEQASEEERQLFYDIKLGYSESQGHPLLREGILRFYAADSIDNVVVASPGELHFSLMNVLLEAGDHVIVTGPCYQSHTEVVKAIGCELSYWYPNAENWHFAVDDLAELIQPSTKLIVINFPHNPTGSYLERTQLEAIIELARAHDIYLYSDEMYHKLMLGDTAELPPACDLYEKAISLWGTSKSFGAAGFRIGWLVSQDQALLQQVVAYKDYLSICSNTTSEILTLMVLNQAERYIQANVQKIAGNVQQFQAFAEGQPLIKKFILPRAGSTAFVELNISESALQFSNRLVETAGIMTLPAEMFEYPGPYIRLGFGREKMREGLEQFADFLTRKGD